MAASWFYTTDGKNKRGPFTFQQLQELARTGELRPGHMVRQAGVPGWRRGREVDDLFQPAEEPVESQTADRPPRPKKRVSVIREADDGETFRGGRPKPPRSSVAPPRKHPGAEPPTGSRKVWLVVSGIAAVGLLVGGVFAYRAYFGGTGSSQAAEQPGSTPADKDPPVVVKTNKIAEPIWRIKSFSECYQLDLPGDPTIEKTTGKGGAGLPATYTLVTFVDSDIKLYSWFLSVPENDKRTLNEFFIEHIPVLPTSQTGRADQIVHERTVEGRSTVGKQEYRITGYDYSLRRQPSVKDGPSQTHYRVFRTDKKIYVAAVSGTNLGTNEIVGRYLSSLYMEGMQTRDMRPLNLLASPQWRKRVFADRGYELDFPGDPAPDVISTNGRDDPEHTIRTCSLRFEDDPGVSLFSYVLPLSDDEGRTLTRFYKEYVPHVSPIYRLSDYAIEREKVIQDDKIGCQLTCRKSPNEDVFGPEWIRCRVFRMAKKVYVVVAFGDDRTENNPVIDRFFKSLKIEGQQPGRTMPDRPVPLAKLWQKYRDDLGHFEIDMPGRPTEARTRDKVTRTTVTSATVDVDGADLRFKVSSIRLAKRDKQSDKDFFADIKADFLDVFPDGKLKDEKNITLSDMPGLQLTIETEAETIVWAIVRDRLRRHEFEIEVAGTRLQDYQQDIARFFKSFRFVN